MRLYLLIFSTFILWCALPAQAASVDNIAAVVHRIAPDSIDASIRRLVAFGTRFVGTDSNAAASVWLNQRLAVRGYPVRFDTFLVTVDRTYQVTVNGTVEQHRFKLDNLPQWNVLGVKRGVLHPERTVILGAHYDTIAIDHEMTDQSVAPGADDNASGVAALLEIARLLEGVDLDDTVVFALWSGEELGLIGSGHYAAQARARGDDVVVMMQLDAIATQSTSFQNAFTIDTTGSYLSLGEDLAGAAHDYSTVTAYNGTGGSVLITPRGCGCSDHQSFLDNGFPALGIFQYFYNPSPHMNTSNDTLEHVDLTLVTGVTQATLAELLKVAGFPGRSADFNGDGRVDFSDFVMFAQAYNAPLIDARFDLDRDGVIGFSDFLLFAGVFGQ